MSFDLLGTGSCLPARCVKNDELTQLFDTSDEWIRMRTGIEERHIITDEQVAGLAIAAAKAALRNSGTSAEELDYILCPTLGGDYITPSLACMVQQGLGAKCPAMDMNAACSGFVYACDIADGLFARGRAKRVLVVAADGLSRILDWNDRSTSVLFGDGAAAVVLGEGDGLKYLAVGSAPSLALNLPFLNGNCPYTAKKDRQTVLQMDGREVYRFAVDALGAGGASALEATGYAKEEVRFVVPHQANLRIIEAAAKRLRMPMEQFACNIQKNGNISAVSIPLVLDEFMNQGRLHKGDILVFSAFGAGMTAGTAVLQWKI